MSLSLASVAPLSFAPVVPALRSSVAPAASALRMETLSDLESLAAKCNPIVGFWDPLGLAGTADRNAYSESQVIGWLRHAEIKHGRVAMAAFIGFIVAENGIHFPWDLANGVSYESIAQLAFAQARPLEPQTTRPGPAHRSGRRCDA